MNDARLAYVLGVAGISLLATACGGEKASHMQGSNTTSTAAPAAAPPPAGGAAPGSTAAGGAAAGSTGTTGAAAGAAAGSTSAAGAAGAAGGGGESSITPAMIALGDSVFHGKAGGGLCYTCHGPDEKGTTLAPDLTDKTWIDGDGSYNYLVQRVTTGVPQPKQYPAPMPPKGGADLSDAQVRAVAAYVYSLSHPEVGKK